jgi:hypothetical protein
MLNVIEAGLDLVNAVAGKRAAAKRLAAAKKKYGDDLVLVRLGKQRMLLSRPVLDVMVRTGQWALLQQAAERGDDVSTLT